jgi:hypothetical protein
MAYKRNGEMIQTVAERSEALDGEVIKAVGKGWIPLKGFKMENADDQQEAVRLLKAVARRNKLELETNIWTKRPVVTYKVTRKPLSLREMRNGDS